MHMKPSPQTARLGRRQFIRSTSLALGTTALLGPGLVHAGGNEGLRGAAQSGAGDSALPLRNIRVRLYEATNAAPRLLGSAITNASGRFTISNRFTSGACGTALYLTVDLGGGVQLVTVLGTSLPEFATVNEFTTVAAGFAMAQFTKAGAISGEAFGLRMASGMSENLVSLLTGDASMVMLSSPNGDETNSLRSLRALANLLALFVRNGGAGLDLFFDLATPPGGLAPGNYLQALSNIARFPQQNVAELFALARAQEIFAPSLERQPDAWTIVVKVNDTGSDAHLFGGPGNVAFDADGFAWITNNVVQGYGYSGQFNVVLQPNGKPANGRGASPKSPLLGGGAYGAGFGVAVAPRGDVWMGNFGWGGPAYVPSPTGFGSVVHYDRLGQPLSGPVGYRDGVHRAQGIAADAEGNIWICSFGNDRMCVFPHGDHNRAIHFQLPNGSAPFDVQIGSDGSAWVSLSGGLAPSGNSSIARFALVRGQIRQLFSAAVGHGNKALSLDSRNQAWIASGGDSCVYLLDAAGQLRGPFTGGGIDSPWSTAVDGDDNIWVANFGPQVPNNNFTTAALSKLAGSNPATCPPGLQAGDPISPVTGYTLPSAGAQVLLHNGNPLYGPGAPPCFCPLMRVTGVAIDQAGNVWAMNNWKPNVDVDVSSNPGGDGVCIFVGLAKPPTRRC